MTPFELVEPASLGEAIALLDPEDAGVRPIAGGTALRGAADRRRHGADADDEGRRIPPDAARQLAQARAA